MTRNHANTAGQLIKRLRAERLKTQGQLAAEFGKTVSYWSAVETGSKPVTPAVLKFVIETLELCDEVAEQLTKLSNQQSQKQQKLDLTGVNDDARELATAFAMNLKSLDKSQIEKMQAILSETK